MNRDLLVKSRVLIFDDSIDSSTTIQTIIGTLLSYEVKCITVACLIAKAESFTSVHQKYKDMGIKFLIHKCVDDCGEYYEHYMAYYLDYLCMPQRTDLLVEKYSLPIKMSKYEVMNLLKIDDNSPKDDNNLIGYDNHFKMYYDLIETPFLDALFIKNNDDFILKGTNIILSQVEIRFFVHMHDNFTDIYVEYIIEPCNSDFECCAKLFDYASKCDEKKNEHLFCIACIIYNIAKRLGYFLEKSIVAAGITFNYELLPWIMDNTLVDVNQFNN